MYIQSSRSRRASRSCVHVNVYAYGRCIRIYIHTHTHTAVKGITIIHADIHTSIHKQIPTRQSPQDPAPIPLKRPFQVSKVKTRRFMSTSTSTTLHPLQSRPITANRPHLSPGPSVLLKLVNHCYYYYSYSSRANASWTLISPHLCAVVSFSEIPSYLTP